MAKVTLFNFAKNGQYTIVKERSIPARPIVLSKNELTRIQNDLIQKICRYAPKRPHPGGALSHPSMWAVRPRSLKNPNSQAFGFEVFAVKEEPLEKHSMFRHRDTSRSMKNARYHYAWWVEFGHKVFRPDFVRDEDGRFRPCKLPFIKQGGKLWRVNVEGWARTKGASRKWYRVMERPIWDDYGTFSKRSMVKVIPQIRRAKAAHGRQYYVNKTKLLWLRPGTKTQYVPGVFFVKKALDEVSNELFETVWNAYFDTAKLSGMSASTIAMYKRQKPIAIVNEDNYENEAYLKTRITAPGMYSIVIKRG